MTSSTFRRFSIDPVTGHLRREMATLFSRPYAESVAGRLVYQIYFTKIKYYYMAFISNGSKSKTTVRLSEDEWGYGDAYHPVLQLYDLDGRMLTSNDEDLSWGRGRNSDIKIYVSPRHKGKEVRLTILPVNLKKYDSRQGQGAGRTV
jgi:hypothetical protein